MNIENITTRRDFLKASLMGVGAVMTPQLFAVPTIGKPPTRFIFMHMGNGLFPDMLALPTFSSEEKEMDTKKVPFEVDLGKHKLADWMQPLEEHKANLTILQGLSGRMCTASHASYQSSLGVFRGSASLNSIKRATIDFELANLFPSPFKHIELACFPFSRNPEGISMGYSARGAKEPNFAFGSPRIAMLEMFKAVSSDPKVQARNKVEQQLMSFLGKNTGSLMQGLTSSEQGKLKSYSEAFVAQTQQDRDVNAIADSIRKNMPKLDPKYLASGLNTVDRQYALTEVLLSALISGMTNVITFTLDQLDTNYGGLVEGEEIKTHPLGHNQGLPGFTALELRKKINNNHVKLIDTIVKRLKSVPEGDGTMFDNTMLFYWPDSGETHHSIGLEYPMTILAGKNSKLNLGCKYIRLPYVGSPGCKTLGNWYTTLLNAYGNPIKHYGDFDLALISKNIDQSGPIKQFLS